MSTASSFAQRLLLYSAVFAIAASGIVAGCDFLDKPPKGQLTEAQFFQDQADAVAATNATYSQLRNYSVHVFSWLGMTDIASDDATKGSVPGDAEQLVGVLDDLSWSTANGAFTGTWSGYYSGVYRANQAIANIPSVDMDADLRERLVAENRFLRAYFYFFLVRAYGDVPKITRPLNVEEIDNVTRAPSDSVYALIESDLRTAASVLPPKGSIEAGRANAGAARGLLAKVNLFRAAALEKEGASSQAIEAEYQEALEAAEAVIESGNYSLTEDYFSIFRESGEFGPESVFEVASADLAEGGGTVQYAQFQGVRGTPNLGFGFNAPSPDLEASYEPGDPRQQATILYPWEEVPGPSDAVVHLNTSLTNQRYNEKAQARIDANGSFNTEVNLRRLRYADVVLIAAESAAHLGQDATAREYLNDVREMRREGRTFTMGIQPEIMPSQIAEVLGVSDSGPHVMVRYADGPAAAAGVESIEVGRFEGATPVPAIVNQVDVIESVGGTEITSLDDLYAAVDAAGSNSVTVEVLRLTQSSSNGSVSTQTQTLTASVTPERLLPDISTSGEQLVTDIWQERRHELAMEQHRWFEILRQNRIREGRAERLMEDVGKDWDSAYTRYPIPQTEVDRAGLEQNPGY